MLQLDLHGKRHEDARLEVERFINANWGSGQEVEIVTGNSDEMKRIIGLMLDQYKLDYQIGRPTDLNNSGYIVTQLV